MKKLYYYKIKLGRIANILMRPEHPNLVIRRYLAVLHAGLKGDQRTLVSISSTLNVRIFLYERCFGNVHVTRKKRQKPTFVQKFARLTLMKSTPAGTGSQHLSVPLHPETWLGIAKLGQRINSMMANFTRFCAPSKRFWHTVCSIISTILRNSISS